MSSSRGAQSPQKRLLKELQEYHSDPNDALLELGPVSDNELMEWRAVMKGVEGTAYEGTDTSSVLICNETVHPASLQRSLRKLSTTSFPPSAFARALHIQPH